jgi:dodecin
MSIVRNVEVIAESPKGFDAACQEAVKEASKTLRGIKSFWIKNAECIVEDDKITMYRVNGTSPPGGSHKVSPGRSAVERRTPGFGALGWPEGVEIPDRGVAHRDQSGAAAANLPVGHQLAR